MARDPKQLRKAYEYKLGKDLAGKLSDTQISELSKYYNSLTPAQQSEVDSETVMGKGEFLNTARSMADPLKYPSNQSVLPESKEEETKQVSEKLPKISNQESEPSEKPKPKINISTPSSTLKKVLEKKEYSEVKTVNKNTPDKDLSVSRQENFNQEESFSKEDKIIFDKIDELLKDGEGDETSNDKTEIDSLKPLENESEISSSNKKEEEEEVSDDEEEVFKRLDELLVDIKKETDSLESYADKDKTEKEEEVSDDDKVEKEEEEVSDDEKDYDKLEELINEVRDEQETIFEDLEKQKDDIKNVENEQLLIKKDLNDFKDEIEQLKEKDSDEEEKDSDEEEKDSDEEEKDSAEEEDEIVESIDKMDETLKGIDALLKDILGQEKKENEREKINAQKASRASEEKEAEKSTKKSALNAFKGVKLPKIGFLDRIKTFFTNILLGGVVLKLLKWIQDPENQKTIDNVVNFVTKHMDKILIGLATLVGLSIGMKIVGFLTTFLPIIKGLLALLTGPAGLIALLTVGTLIAAEKYLPKAKETINRQRFGGKKETEEGIRYSGGEVQDFKNDLENMLDISKGDDFLNYGDTRQYTEEELKEIKSPEFRELVEKELKKLVELQKRIQITKSVNDQLFVLNEKLKSEEERLEELESKENPSSRDKNLITKYKESITRIKERIDEKKTNKEQSVKKEQKIIKTIDFEKLKASPAIEKIIPDGIKQSLSESTPSPPQQQENLNRVLSENEFYNASVMDPTLPDTYEEYLKQNQKNEPPIVSPLSKLMPSTEPTGVKKVIIGAGHAPTPENAAKGIPLGSDNRNVEGTADDGSSGGNTNPTGVTEWQATKQVVDALKMMVKDRGLEDKIGFEDIYSYDGLTEVPRRVESTTGQQYVDLHFDARGFGKEGVLPSRNESATDKSLMEEFGRYSDTFDPSDKGVTRAGGTLVELGRIDDPKIRGLLEEVKRGEIGPETNKMAERVLRGIVPSIETSPNQQNQSFLPKNMRPSLMEIPIPPPDGSNIASLPPMGMKNKNKGPLSSSQAGQKAAPIFSSEDLNNLSVTAVRSLYNTIT